MENRDSIGSQRMKRKRNGKKHRTGMENQSSKCKTSRGKEGREKFARIGIRRGKRRRRKKKTKKEK